LTKSEALALLCEHDHDELRAAVSLAVEMRFSEGECDGEPDADEILHAVWRIRRAMGREFFPDAVRVEMRRKMMEK
jgi:hypothetical protein